ncbi:hypothetical protein AAIB33_09470 [Microbacterium sp. AZCO]|uniref:DUF7455 domain-containing protein n=1 Tax=Microbacterium sp. AZCO TaxID=3142976 RepID=UPI0031F42812
MDTSPVDIIDRHRTAVLEMSDDICLQCDTDAKVQAYVYAELPSGRSVAYCAHHGTVYWERLNELALVVIDHRDQVPA